MYYNVSFLPTKGMHRFLHLFVSPILWQARPPTSRRFDRPNISRYRSTKLNSYRLVYLLDRGGLHERGGDTLLHGQDTALAGLDSDGGGAQFDGLDGILNLYK